MALQVDLRRDRTVRGAEDVELPVAERCSHRVQVVHCHPRSVLGHVTAEGPQAGERVGARRRLRGQGLPRVRAGVGVRAPAAALVDEQDVMVLGHRRPRVPQSDVFRSGASAEPARSGRTATDSPKKPRMRTPEASFQAPQLPGGAYPYTRTESINIESGNFEFSTVPPQLPI
jgi:hypothetical protein